MKINQKNGYKIEFTVGTGFDRDNKSILPFEAVMATVNIENVLVNLFGGFSRYVVEGGWRVAGKTIREQAVVFRVLMTVGELPDEELRNKVSFAQDTIRDTFRQTTVIVTVEECNLIFN